MLYIIFRVAYVSCIMLEIWRHFMSQGLTDIELAGQTGNKGWEDFRLMEE